MRYCESGSLDIRQYCGSTQQYLSQDFPFLVRKRVVPTITFSNTSYTNCSNLVSALQLQGSFRVGVSSGTSAPMAEMSTNWLAVSEI